MATKPPLTLEEQTAKAKLRALAQGVCVWKLDGSETPGCHGLIGTIHHLDPPALTSIPHQYDVS